MKAFSIIVFGDVQGVNYRYFAKKEAQRLGLVGWVKNEQNGMVTAFIQGEAGNVDKFIEWAKVGSPMATVEEVKAEITNTDENLKGFEIK